MKKLTILILLVGTAFASKGQNQFHQSQYMYHRAFVNPGATVSYNSLNAAAFYKNQWSGFSGAPVLQGISVVKPFESRKAAWGAQLIHDKIGVNNVIDISGTYGYKVQLNEEMRLGLGLTGVLHMAQSNFSDVETTVSNDPMYQQNTSMQMMPNFRFGAYLYSNEYYAGLAIPNLLKNQVISAGEGETSFDTKDMHFYINAGYKLQVTDALDVWPSLMLKHVSGTPLQFDININATFEEKVGVGLAYRSSKEFIMMGNYTINEQFLIGYSYDVGFSDLSLFHNGSHEILLIYKVRTSYKDQPKTQKRTTI